MENPAKDLNVGVDPADERWKFTKWVEKLREGCSFVWKLLATKA